jgi:hypothetical protein
VVPIEDDEENADDGSAVVLDLDHDDVDANNNCQSTNCPNPFHWIDSASFQ